MTKQKPIPMLRRTVSLQEAVMFAKGALIFIHPEGMDEEDWIFWDGERFSISPLSEFYDQPNAVINGIERPMFTPEEAALPWVIEPVTNKGIREILDAVREGLRKRLMMDEKTKLEIEAAEEEARNTRIQLRSEGVTLIPGGLKQD